VITERCSRTCSVTLKLLLDAFTSKCQQRRVRGATITASASSAVLRHVRDPHLHRHVSNETWHLPVVAVFVATKTLRAVRVWTKFAAFCVIVTASKLNGKIAKTCEAVMHEAVTRPFCITRTTAYSYTRCLIETCALFSQQLNTSVEVLSTLSSSLIPRLLSLPRDTLTPSCTA